MMADDKQVQIKIKKIEEQLKKLNDSFLEQSTTCLEEIQKLRNEEKSSFGEAVKNVRKFLADDIKRLKKMCKASFKKTVTVKANVEVCLGMNFDSVTFGHEESFCIVKCVLPKDMSGLRNFIETSEGPNHIDGNILNEDAGFKILPEVSEHLREARLLHGKIMKKICREYEKLKLDPDRDSMYDFCYQVLDIP